MLTTKDLDELPNYLLSLYWNLEQSELKKLAETLNVKKLEQLLNLHINPDNIFKKIAKLNNKSQKEIEEIFKSSIKYSQDLDKKIADALGKKLPPINEQLINAQVLQTKGLCSNITNTMGFMIDGQVTPLAKIYQKAADSAYLKVSTGMYDLNGAIKSVMGEMCDKGLLFVEYESGYKMTVEAALRRNIITGVNQTVSEITKTNAQDLGVDKFEVSAHIGARNTGDGWENHEKWQGKVYTMNQLKSICGLGTITGLCGVNCRHSYYMFFEGISERSYTDEELKNMSGEPFYYKNKLYSGTYEASQKQRQIERNIRRLKRMEAGGFDVTDKLKKQFYEYRQFSKTAGLPTQYGRLKTYGKIDNINSSQLFKYKNKVAQNIDIKTKELKELTKTKKTLESKYNKNKLKDLASMSGDLYGKIKDDLYYDVMTYKNYDFLINQKQKEIDLLKNKKASQITKEVSKYDKLEDKIKKEVNLSIEELKDEFLNKGNNDLKKYYDEILELESDLQSNQVKEEMINNINKEIEQAKEEIKKIESGFNKYSENYSDIWYTEKNIINDWKDKKDSIKDKIKYFNDKIKQTDDEDIIKKFKNLKKKTKEFEKLGFQFEEDNLKINSLKEKISQLDIEKLKIENPEKYKEIYEGIYSQGRKDKAMWAKTAEEADEKLRNKCGDVWLNSGIKERKVAHNYTQTFKYMNEPLRGQEYIGDASSRYIYGVEKDIEILTNMIDKSTYDFDAWYQRGVQGYFDIFENLRFANVEDAQQIVGKIFTDGGFLSCSVKKGGGFDGNIIMNIYCPAGTKGLYAEPFSFYGRDVNGIGDRFNYELGFEWDGKHKQEYFGSESEIILQRGYSYRVTKVTKNRGTWYVDMEVILGSEKQNVSNGKIKFE